MEEKKLDINSIIGFVLIFGILLGWMYLKQPSPEEIEAQKAQQEEQKTEQKNVEPIHDESAITERPPINLNDSTTLANYKNAIGSFSFTKRAESITILENEVLYLEIANKGGQIVKAKMKQFITYDSIPVYLVKDGNADFGLTFTTNDNRILETQDLFFEPTLTTNGSNKVLSMKAKVSANQYLEYQ